MRPRARLLVAGVALFAGLVAPARAAPQAVEVARVGTDTLRAGEEDGQLCLSIVAQQSSRECEQTEAGLVTVSGVLPRGTKLVGVAAPWDTASVEVYRGGVLLASATTAAGEAYRGSRAGSLRFALVRLPDAAPIDGLRVRALDAAGTLVAVLAPSDSELVTGRRRLLAGRSAGVPWSLTTSSQSELSPSVLDLGHETVSQCVNANVLRGGVSGSTQSCASEFSQGPLELEGLSEEEHCPDFRLVYGVVPGSVARVSVLLGNGRLLTGRTVPGGDGRRAYALATGVGAVRGIRLIDADGTALVLRRGLAPLAVLCPGPDEGIGIGLSDALDEPLAVSITAAVATLAGSPPVRVADGPGDSLCLAIADTPFRLGSCTIVSPWLGVVRGTFDRGADPHAFVVAVPARVRTVRFSSRDGMVVHSIATVPGEEYTGRYAGHVRFAAVSFASLAEIERITLLDAADAVLLGNAHIADDDLLNDLRALRFSSPRRLAGRAGSPSLWQTSARSEDRSVRCLALTQGAAPGRDARCQFAGDAPAVLLEASCAPNRLSVAVTTRPGTRVLADVGAPSPRRLRLRNASGLLTLVAARPLRALTFIRKGRVRRLRINAPPAARQCGWSAVRDVSPG